MGDSSFLILVSSGFGLAEIFVRLRLGFVWGSFRFGKGLTTRLLLGVEG